MTTACPICDKIASKKGLVCESADVAILLPDSPATPGHAWIVPKKHAPILEQVPEPVAKEMFQRANRISIGLFEALGVAGTNILLQNGLPAGQKLPHAVLSVVARKDGDGFPLQWNPKELKPEDLGSLEGKIKEHILPPGAKEPEPQKPLPEKKPEEKKGPEHDYLVRAFRRLP